MAARRHESEQAVGLAAHEEAQRCGPRRILAEAEVARVFQHGLVHEGREVHAASGLAEVEPLRRVVEALSVHGHRGVGREKRGEERHRVEDDE